MIPPPLRDHPCARFLHLVSSPSRYIGGEFGTRVKSRSAVRGAICLCFPDVYEVGMSHLGTQILYYAINAEPDLAAERCFAPWADMEAELRRRGLPLASLETWTPLSAFDCVGFSLQHELSYTNVLNCLDLGGIPLLAAERAANDPIVLGGGPCASHPEPLAPFFDAFFIGEAEGEIAGILRSIGELRRSGRSRQDILISLAARPGIYCPSMYEPEPDPLSGWGVPRPVAPGAPERVGRVFVPGLDAHPVPEKAVIPWGRAVFDRVSFELSRGCSEGCRFCEAGYTYRPLRDRSPRAILDACERALGAGGYEEFSLCSLSPADYPALAPLVRSLSTGLAGTGVTFSVSSLRAYGLPESVLWDLREGRVYGLTLAPEAGTQRLRDVINKNVTDRDLLDTASRAFASGWQRLKLYFMIGLPTETDEDALAIARLSREALRTGRSSARRAQVTASVGLFVPRPHTPFQWEGMAAPGVVDGRQSLVADALRRTGVDLKYVDARQSRLECVLTRGDRRVAGVVLAAFRKGCRFDGWDEVVRHDPWEEAFLESGVDPSEFTRPVPAGAGVPWDCIDPLVSTAFLLRERERAFAGRPLAPCEKPSPRGGGRPSDDDYLAARRVICYRCGAGCDPRDLADRRRETVIAGRAMDGAPATRPSHDAASPLVPALWHIVFTKCERAAWLSQRDLVKHLPRIFRRAGIRVAMSAGFHPMPKVSYRPPGSVGYQSIGEWVDAVLLLPEGEAPDLGALNAASVDGIEFLRASRAERPRPAPQQIRFAFVSPVPPDAFPLTPPASVQPMDSPPPAPLAGLPGEPLLLVWPASGAGVKPHEALSAAAGHQFRPFDLVRLYPESG